MPSGWDVYYVVFLSALLALGIPAALALVASIVKPVRPAGPEKRQAELPDVSSEAGEPGGVAGNLGEKTNARFFLAANAALLLITLTLALIPSAGALRPGPKGGDDDGLLLGLALIVSISGFAALGLFYSARKGDLSWLKTFRPQEDPPKEGGP